MGMALLPPLQTYTNSSPSHFCPYNLQKWHSKRMYSITFPGWVGLYFPSSSVLPFWKTGRIFLSSRPQQPPLTALSPLRSPSSLSGTLEIDLPEKEGVDFSLALHWLSVLPLHQPSDSTQPATNTRQNLSLFVPMTSKSEGPETFCFLGGETLQSPKSRLKKFPNTFFRLQLGQLPTGSKLVGWACLSWLPEAHPAPLPSVQAPRRIALKCRRSLGTNN